MRKSSLSVFYALLILIAFFAKISQTIFPADRLMFQHKEQMDAEKSEKNEKSEDDASKEKLAFDKYLGLIFQPTYQHDIKHSFPIELTLSLPSPYNKVSKQPPKQRLFLS